MGAIGNWVSWRLQHLKADIRFDAAIWNRRKALENLERACSEKFKVIHLLEEQIVHEEVIIAENTKIVTGAVIATVDDANPDHREAGQRALERILKSKDKVKKLRDSQERHRNELIVLREDHQAEEKILQDLLLDKPRALSELESSWAQKSAYDRAIRPVLSDKVASAAMNYKVKAAAQRDSYRFLSGDIYDAYKVSGSVGELDGESVAQAFDSLVEKETKRRATNG